MVGLGTNKQSGKTEIEPESLDYQEATHALAEAARHKRDASHLTQRGIEADQETFEQAARIRDRAKGVVKESLYHVDTVDLRNANEREEAIKAQEQNARRNILDRLLGRNKITSYDIMRDEADRMNKLVDQRVQQEGGSISSQEAMDEIGQSKEFMPDTWSEAHSMGRQEAVASLLAEIRSKAPRIERDMNTGNVGNFVDFVSEADAKTRSREESNTLRAAAAYMLTQKLDTFIRTRDIYTTEALLSNAGNFLPITQEVLDSIPDEFLKAEEIRNALKKSLADQGEIRGQLVRELERRERELA